MNGLSQNLLGTPWITTSCRETTPLYAQKKECPDNAVRGFLENIDKSLDGMNLKMSQKNAVVKFFLGVLYFLEYHEFPWNFSDNLLNPTNKYLSGEFRADSHDEEITKALAYLFKEIISNERTTNHTLIDQSKGIVLKMERTNGVLNSL